MQQGERRRRPRGAVRDGLVAAGLELARTGGPDAVVLREATRMVGVVPNAAYRHFADRDELLAAVCAAAMNELAARMAAGVARVPGRPGEPDAARGRLRAIGTAYLTFAREEPGLFATAFALPQQHPYGVPDGRTEPDRSPLNQLRTRLDELVHPEDRPGCRQAVAASLDQRGLPGRFPCRVRAADGTWRHVEATVSPYRHSGGTDQLLVTARDVSDQVALRRQVTHLTFHDGLTGLPNRA